MTACCGECQRLAKILPCLDLLEVTGATTEIPVGEVGAKIRAGDK